MVLHGAGICRSGAVSPWKILHAGLHQPSFCCFLQQLSPLSTPIKRGAISTTTSVKHRHESHRFRWYALAESVTVGNFKQSSIYATYHYQCPIILLPICVFIKTPTLFPSYVSAISGKYQQSGKCFRVLKLLKMSDQKWCFCSSEF